jgi:hypothetical protein
METINQSRKEFYRVHVRFGGILKRKRTMQVHLKHIGDTDSLELENLSGWARKAREFVAVNARQVNGRLFLCFTKCVEDGEFISEYIGSPDNMQLCIDDISTKE